MLYFTQCDPDSLHFIAKFATFLSYVQSYKKNDVSVLFFESQNLSTALFFVILKFVDRVIFVPYKIMWTGGFFILAKTLLWLCIYIHHTDI